MVIMKSTNPIAVIVPITLSGTSGPAIKLP